MYQRLFYFRRKATSQRELLLLSLVAIIILLCLLCAEVSAFEIDKDRFQAMRDILSHFKEGASYSGRVVQARTFPQVSDSQRKPMFSLHRLNIPSARRYNYKYRGTSIRGQEKSFALYPRHKWTRVYGSVAKLSKKTKRYFTENIQIQKNKWRKSIDALQRQANKKKDEYQEDIENLKQKSKSKLEEYKKDIKEIKDKTIKILQSPEIKSYLVEDEFLNQDAGKKEIYIFISSSMHKRNLIDLGKQAQKHNASFILRGFINNNYIETIDFFKEIIQKSGQGIVIDPEMFKIYQIQAVPSFVIASGNKYDKLSGNVTLKYAISEMKSKGEIFSER